MDNNFKHVFIGIGGIGSRITKENSFPLIREEKADEILFVPVDDDEADLPVKKSETE